jgi:high-affinity iron transporter
MARRVTRLLGFLAVLAVALLAAASSAGAADTGAVSRDQGIAKLQDTRRSIDRTLQLIKEGQAEQAFQEARNGYLSHFELVEVPLRVADNRLTIEAEGKFAEIRQMIRSGAPVDEIRDEIIKLRGLMDDAERKLTDTGLGAPAIVTAQSFLILFREGFEVVLLLAVLLGYLEAAKAGQYMRPILAGVGLAAVATVITVLLMPTLFALLPVGREVLEAIVALLAVVVLFYVSFWLIARLEHRRWLEFVKARMWRAVSIGSAASLVLVGFTAVYREGFETALFYQALLTFGPGLGGYVALGIAIGVVALAVVAYGMFRLGRKMPIKVFMNTAIAFVMITSIAFLGNAVHTLQSADVVPYTLLAGWPRLPIFLAEATGYWPTLQVVVAQLALTAVYIGGAIYVFVVKPRLHRRAARPAGVAAAAQAA